MGLRSRSGNYIKFFVYVVMTVLINIAGTTLFFRADLTEEGIYSISEVSKRMVSSLSEPLTINVFFTKNLPAPHNNTERYLRDLLEEYSVYGNQYFNYRFYDVSPDEGDVSRKARENQELARNYGIYPVQLRAIQKDEVTFQKAYMGLVLIHGDLIERIPTVTTTKGLEYTLTSSILKLHNKISALLSLPEKIKLTLFLSSSLKIVAPYMQLNELPGLPEKIREIAKKVSAKNYGRLEFEFLDPSTDKEVEKALSGYNLMSLQWPELSDGKIPAGKGVIGLVMEYGEKAREIPLLRVTRVPFIGTHYELVDMKKMEEVINENIESLIDINEDIGYLADHGTLNLSRGLGPARDQKQDSLTTFANIVSQGYALKNVTLKDGAVPEGINCLILARPTEPFSDYELFQIDQFLMRGKNIALFLDMFDEVIPSETQQRMPAGVRYVPIKTGLEKLLTHYGIGLRESYVLDEHCYRQPLPTRFGGGQRSLYFVPVIKNEFINKDLGFMKNIKGLITMKISPLELYPERFAKSDLEAHTLFSSSDRSWEMSGRINLDPRFTRPPRDEKVFESFPLACILEGKLPSYFADKPIPEKKSGEEDTRPAVDLSKIESQGSKITKGAPGRLFVLASSEMLHDNMLDESGKSPNAMFILNVLDYLNNREGFAELRSKEQRFNPLMEIGGGVKTFVKTFNIIGLPTLVVVFGLMVWFFRHSRKRRIKMMFQK